jgi:hypothetical protein
MALDCIGTPVGLLIMNRRYVRDVAVPGPDAQNFSSRAHPDTPVARTRTTRTRHARGPSVIFY